MDDTDAGTDTVISDEGDTGGWQALLRRAVVMLTVPSGDGRPAAVGTGFFVAPGLVATCAHVLAATPEALPARVRGRLVALGSDLDLRTDPGRFFRDTATGLDLALLTADGVDRAVTTSAQLRTQDLLWTFGHPAGQFRAGQHASFTYQGDSRRSPDEALELPRVYGVPVGPGYSGSPVVNTRTGAVCGMLSTSDKAGSAHLIPITAILARCPEAASASHGEWLAALTDEQLAAGGWAFPGPRLVAYLTAAASRASDHPYPGVLADVRRPPLSRVYVRQHASARARGKLTADEIFGGDRDVVLMGGPGAGKTSLLHSGVSGIAEHWLALRRTGRSDVLEGGADVPLRVPATDLTRSAPLADQLGRAVRADLGGRLRESLPKDIFARPPMPGKRWLVLVDGLDEVLAPERRRDVIAGIQENRSGPYRFVVACRPLPEAELAEFRRTEGGVDTYELLPFDAGQLYELALGWCKVFEAPDPERAAHDLVAKTGRIRPSTLVHNPLLATMLCQLYLSAPERPLPSGRYGLYRDFIDLLCERQYASGQSGIVAQAHAALDPYGVSSEEARELPRRIFEALPRLAKVRWTEPDDRPAVALVANWIGDLRPAAMRMLAWEELLRACLRRTGLLAEHAGDVVFMHQTLTEFLAAQAISADPESSRTELRKLFGGFRRQGFYEFSEGNLLSGDLFLIAAWHADPQQRPHLERVLRRLAARKDLNAGTAIARITADGIPLDEEIIKTAIKTLGAHFDDPHLHARVRLRAGQALADLDDPRGVQQLLAIAARSFGIEPFWVEAARALAVRGHAQGVGLLKEFVEDTELFLSWRVDAASFLAELGDAAGIEFLTRTCDDPAAPGHDRIEAAYGLTEMGHPHGWERLSELARDPANDLEWPITVIRDIAAMRLPRRVEILEALADLPERHQSHSRIIAAEELAELGVPSGIETLAAIAADRRYNRYVRRTAKRKLARFRKEQQG
ncbi:Trypsin-like peptidase domain-containing protein [Actinomadura meyerae]|uniref:Trypsin-like peptidase domain-containing protein n=1 Tax=Actinomadura meyerae TaxID=240840 RepID=A0A239P9E0_9ACTN|nr:trypsin-like peptidase domain-containing protein [Actinomadura meyerae]SNT63029.1 Trypsin-like peptidase domain-containing protein [Actinomadura meyerae]